MPCPVTTGFLYSLENNHNDKERNTSFEFVADSKGSFPSLRAQAAQEPERAEVIYRMRAQYAIQLVISQLKGVAPALMVPVFEAPTPEGMLEQLTILRDEIEDLITVSKMKRKTNGPNMRTLSDRMVVREALKGVEKQLSAIIVNDYRKVGYGLGDCFRGLHLSPDRALAIGRKLLEITV